MKNNIINEITHIKNLMAINEASIIKFKFSDGIKPKLINKLNALDDNDVKGFNLEIKKESPYRSGVEVTEKIDTKTKLLDELNKLDNIDIKNFNTNQKNFIKELNSRLDDIDPKYIKELAETFKSDFKNSDDLTKGKFLSTFKQLLEGEQYGRFEKEIQGFTLKVGILPILKDVIKGSKELVVPMLKSKYFWGLSILASTGLLKPLYRLLNEGGSSLNTIIDESLKTKGAKLFKLLLNNQDILTSGLSPEEISNIYGITEENKAEMDKYAQDFFNTKSWFKTTTGEVEELFNNITTNFDGINFIYFLSKFQELSGGQSLLRFLREQNIKNIDNIVFSENSINPDFQFLTVMTSDVSTLESINTVMKAVTKSYGGVDGYSQMQIKLDSRNENSDWIPFNNSDKNVILKAINRDGETITFDYNTRTKILNDLKRYVDRIWSKAGTNKENEKISNLFNEIIKNKKVPNNQDLLELSLDPETVYTEVSTELMKDHPEFSKIIFTWPWVQKMNENVIGLARILKEQPVLNKTKKKDNTKLNKVKTSGGDVKTFPGPGKVQQFQDWLDTNYPTWLKGGKLNKGQGYGYYGPSTSKAWNLYKDDYLSVKSNVKDDTNITGGSEIEKLNRLFKFYTKNSREPITIPLDTNLITEILTKSKDLNISVPLAYVRTIYEKYGNNIYQIAIPKEYEKDLSGKKISIDLQLERFNSLLNLILEQSDEYVVLRIINNVLVPKSYNDKSNITINTIANDGNISLKTNSDNYQYPDKSDTISKIKTQMGYETEQGPVMTKEFSNFIIEYQKQNQLPVTGEIDTDLVINLYPNLKSKPKTTSETPPTSNQKPIVSSEFANNKNVKDILIYSKRVDLTGNPDWDTCRMLIDTYSKKIPVIQQSISVGNMKGIETDVTLTSIKNSVEWCIAKHRNKFRLKISDMNRIGNLQNPFNINKDIFNKPETPTVNNSTS